MERKDSGTYVLSSGREINANHGLISVALTNRSTERTFGNFEVGEGYDGHVFDIEEWTPAERAELADYMIEQWEEFKRQSAVKACATSGHEWRPWVYCTSYGFPPERAKVRECHRCLTREEEIVSEVEYQSAPPRR